MELCIVVPHVDYQRLRRDRLGESSAEIHPHVEVVRERQCERFSKIESLTIVSNSNLRVAEVRLF